MMTSSNGNIFRVTGHFCGELNKRLSKQSWGWWFKTLSCSLWRHCNGTVPVGLISLYPYTTKLLGVILVSLRPSVRPSRIPCPLCSIYSSGWILSIFDTNDQWHERVCRMRWPLTLTYIFKVFGPSLRKSCPLCSVYSSGWILFIYGTNDHYH